MNQTTTKQQSIIQPWVDTEMKANEWKMFRNLQEVILKGVLSLN